MQKAENPSLQNIFHAISPALDTVSISNEYEKYPNALDRNTPMQHSKESQVRPSKQEVFDRLKNVSSDEDGNSEVQVYRGKKNRTKNCDPNCRKS